jgi:pyrroline-5-carboxylate reductase
MATQKSIVIIGAGAMGGAMARAIASDKTRAGSWSLTVVDANEQKLADLKNADGIITVSTGYELLDTADVIVLAVKPQSFAELAAEIKPLVSKNALIISIMAGKSIATIAAHLGAKRIVHSMPNLGAQFGESMTVWCGKGLNADDKNFTSDFFSLLGEQIAVTNEDLVDKNTAVSGSGVGFFAYILEAYTVEVTNLGFNKKDAARIAMQVFKATNTIVQQKEKTPAELRAAVTSKGGTTEAGLTILMGKAFSSILKRTFQKAYLRAKKLSK